MLLYNFTYMIIGSFVLDNTGDQDKAKKHYNDDITPNDNFRGAFILVIILVIILM